PIPGRSRAFRGPINTEFRTACARLAAVCVYGARARCFASPREWVGLTAREGDVHLCMVLTRARGHAHDRSNGSFPRRDAGLAGKELPRLDAHAAGGRR